MRSATAVEIEIAKACRRVLVAIPSYTYTSYSEPLASPASGAQHLGISIPNSQVNAERPKIYPAPPCRIDCSLIISISAMNAS